MHVRFDTLPGLAKAKRTRAGTLVVEGFATRVGVFTYRNPDGSIRRELRPPEEVFRLDHLDSIELIPVTLLHPPEGILGDHQDPDLVAKRSVGAVTNPQPHGDFVKVKLSLQTKEAIEAAEAGVQQLSLGYKVGRLDATPGVWRGQQYDAVQRDIVCDHLALLPRGNAGADAKIRLDAFQGDDKDLDSAAESCDEITPAPVSAPVSAPEKPRMATKIRLDAATEIEVDDAHAAPIAAMKARLDAITLERDELKTRSSPEAVNAIVMARSKLLSQAASVLGADAKRLDTEMDETVIHRAVLAKLSPKAKLEGEAPVMVKARFDVAMEAHDEAIASFKDVAAVVTKQEATTGDARTDGAQLSPAEAARQKMIDENKKAYKA